MILAITIALGLAAITFLFHYRALLWLSASSSKLNLRNEALVFAIVVVMFLVHIIEIAFYAVAYFFSVEILHLGEFQGAGMGDTMSYLYYSGVIYTSLGIGDIYPKGHIRFITAAETLNGLLLITWTASFTYLAMGRLWKWDPCCDNSAESTQ